MTLKYFDQKHAGHSFRIIYGTLVNNDRRQMTVQLKDGDKVLWSHKTFPDIEMMDDPMIRPALCQLCLNDYEKHLAEK